MHFTPMMVTWRAVMGDLELIGTRVCRSSDEEHGEGGRERVVEQR